MIIYLVPTLPPESCERPNLLLHQTTPFTKNGRARLSWRRAHGRREGFTTSPRHRGTRTVASEDTPAHFSRFARPRPDEYCLCGTFPRVRQNLKSGIPSLQFPIPPVAVNDFLCRRILRYAGCSDFPPRRTSGRSSNFPSDRKDIPKNARCQPAI